MIKLKFIRENSAEVIKRLQIRNFDASKIINNIIIIDEQRREIQVQKDALLNKLNDISKSIGQLYAIGKRDEADLKKSETQDIKLSIAELEKKNIELDIELNSNLVLLPNLPSDSVPQGKSSDDNVEIRTGGLFPSIENKLPHWDLIKKYDIIDFELGNKITGAGFPVYKSKGAKLQRSLIQFFLDEAAEAGYVEIIPPYLVNEESGFGTGQLPDKEGQMYYLQQDNLYLIPTAEVPVTNLYRDVILSEKELPIKNVAYSACFRREAGSYGADVRGLNRLHQFDKVEIVQICKPDESYKTLEEMINHVEKLLNKLELPYRIIKLCGGDLGFTSAITYDFEVFSAGQEKWLEVSSVSNFEDFQTNRLKLRYKSDKDKKTILAHTLNGSALALPRIMAAIIENNQTDKGIKIPEILVPYTKFTHID